MIRKQLDAEPQPVRSFPEAPKAIDQREPAARYSTRRGSRSLLRMLFTLRNSAGLGPFNWRQMTV
jgi:hypothetical protein